MVNWRSAKRSHVDAERVQVLKSLAAQELSANFMTRCGLALNQHHASPFAGQPDRCGTAGYSTAENENFVLQGNLIQIGRSNGNLLFRTPYAFRTPYVFSNPLP
jgi:hypothetical protein